MDKLLKILRKCVYSNGYLVSNHVSCRTLTKAESIEVRRLLRQTWSSLNVSLPRTMCSLSSACPLNANANFRFQSDYNKYDNHSKSEAPPIRQSLGLLSFGIITAYCASYESGMIKLFRRNTYFGASQYNNLFC